MELSEALYTTRAMRRMKPDPVPDEVIARIVDAGVRAPEPGQEQTWRFVVVTDRQLIARLATIWRDARDAILMEIPNLYATQAQAASSQYLYDHFEEVPVIVFGYGQPGRGRTTVVPALWSMCLAARGENVGSVFTTLLTRAVSQVNEVLAVPPEAGVDLFGAVPMGYPLGRWGLARRQAAHEVTFVDQWGAAPSWRAAVPLLAP
jgi:nitroreductase